MQSVFIFSNDCLLLLSITRYRKNSNVFFLLDIVGPFETEFPIAKLGRKYSLSIGDIGVFTVVHCAAKGCLTVWLFVDSYQANHSPRSGASCHRGRQGEGVLCKPINREQKLYYYFHVLRVYLVGCDEVLWLCLISPQLSLYHKVDGSEAPDHKRHNLWGFQWRVRPPSSRISSR